MEWKEFWVLRTFFWREKKSANNSLYNFIHKYAAKQNKWFCGTEDFFLFKFGLELFFFQIELNGKKMAECDDRGNIFWIDFFHEKKICWAKQSDY